MSSSALVETIDYDVELNQLAVVKNEGEMIPAGKDKPASFRRKIVRQEEVPYMRKMKVPVVTKKVVPHDMKKRIKTKKLVEVEDYEFVDETYTVWEEIPAQREKKVWIQKIVEEEYTKKIPVMKTRIVKRPIVRIEEHDDYHMVTVPGEKVVDVEGFRIDTVHDKKLVEVEEWQVFQLLPHKTGLTLDGEVREVGLIESETIRHLGTHVYSSEWKGFDNEDILLDESAERVECAAPLYKSKEYTRSYSNLDELDEEERKRYASGEWQSSRTVRSGDRYSRSGSGSYTRSGDRTYTTTTTTTSRKSGGRTYTRTSRTGGTKDKRRV